MKFLKYLPLLFVCFLTACSGEPSKEDLLAEVKESNTSLGVYIFYSLKDTSSLRSSLSSTIVLMKNGNNVDSSQLNGAMVTAAALNAEKTLKFLVSKGADVNWSMSGVRALPCAIFAGNLELADWLLNNGASKDAGNITPLMAAVYVYSLHGENRDRALASIQFLLRRYASVSGGDGRENPLIFASSKGYKELVELFLKSPDGHRAMLDRDNTGRTALIAAIQNGNSDIAKLLIDAGADVDNTDRDGQTPLLWATYLNDTDIAKLLIDKGAALNIRDKKGWTPIKWAVDKKNTDLVKLLIEKGADLKEKDEKTGFTLLQDAIFADNMDSAKLLVEKGADVNVELINGQTPLLMAMENDDEEFAKLLVEKGANVNVVGKQVPDKDLKNLSAEDREKYSGRTPLHWAISKNNDALAMLIIEKGADVNAKTKSYGGTPLHLAVRENNVNMVELLINKGANVSEKSISGITPLHLANGKKVGKLLIEKGADVNAKDFLGGGEPLADASWRNSVGVVKLLIEKGADVNAATEHLGYTALMRAAEKGNLEVVKVLLRNGADASATDYRGRVALRLAQENNHEDVAELLLNPSILEEDEDADSASETPKEEPKDKTPTTKQNPNPPEDKGVRVPGYGTTTKNDDALKGILIDLTHARPKKELSTPSSSREKEEKNKYESGESLSKRLRRSIGALSTTWNIGNIKSGNPVSPTTLYTTSIYISDNGGYEYGSRRAFVPPVRSSGSMPCYLCYYEGEFGVPEEGDYRFVGYAESVMLVGVNSGGMGKKMETVLYAFRPGQGFGADVKCGKDWEPARFCGPSTGNDGEEVANSSVKLYKGSWLHLLPGKRYPIKIAFGTISGIMQAQLGIQKKGRDTDDNFPLFTLEKVRFPVYHRRYPGAGYTTLESRETGQYNSTCVFTPPQEQPTPTTKKTLATGTTKRKTSSKPSQTTQSRGNS